MGVQEVSGSPCWKSPFFCLFRPFPKGLKSTWETQQTRDILRLAYHLTENYYKINSETIMDANNYIPFSIINSQTIDVMLFWCSKHWASSQSYIADKLHRRQINSQSIIDVNNYIASDIINSGK